MGTHNPEWANLAFLKTNTAELANDSSSQESTSARQAVGIPTAVQAIGHQEVPAMREVGLDYSG